MHCFYDSTSSYRIFHLATHFSHFFVFRTWMIVFSVVCTMHVELTITITRAWLGYISYGQFFAFAPYQCQILTTLFEDLIHKPKQVGTFKKGNSTEKEIVFNWGICRDQNCCIHEKVAERQMLTTCKRALPNLFQSKIQLFMNTYTLQVT